jgi:sugar phosphate permease
VGYTLSAVNKLLFPMADAVSIITLARIVDRIGKGIRDAPRDAFLTDVLPSRMRGSGFGLRLTFYTAGFVLGPLIASGLMLLSKDDFRVVFWVAAIPAFLAIVVLLAAVRESPNKLVDPEAPPPFRVNELMHFSASFWWSITIASLLSLSRCSQAFLVLKASDVGIDPAYVPLILVLTHAVYSATAYPFGVLADRLERRVQLGLGAVILAAAHLMLAGANAIELTAVGAAFWGLQLAMTQGLLAASVADAASSDRRGTAFAIFDLAVGGSTLVASVAAGGLWVVGGPTLTFAGGACIAVIAIPVLVLQPPAYAPPPPTTQ